jgi:PhnB protein
MNGHEHFDRTLEAVLRVMPQSGFKARLWAKLERKIAIIRTAGVPEGFHTVTPYLLVPDPERMLTFYTAAFGAEETYRTGTPDGMHVMFRIGDSMLMMGGPVENAPTGLHLYVDELEATYQRALDLGAAAIYPIIEAPFGERFAVVTDPAGTLWIVAERATSTLRHPEMGAVTPYVHPEGGAARFIEFLKEAFGADQLERHDEEGRGVAHCKMRVGESILELGDPERPGEARSSMFYLYVGDSHAVYKQALEAGATSIHPPEWMAYGDYVAAFTDPSGNKWFAADYGIES